MGFFSKIWKGVKGTFKKIGKGIKKTFNKFGKFMNKIGILGQVAMMFILPGIGNALLGSVMNLASWGAQAGGLIGGIAKGAAWTLGKAQQFSQLAKGAFNTITKPVTEFFSTAGRYVGSKLQKLMPNVKLPAGWNVPENYTLKQAKSDWWQEGVVKNWNTFKGESSNFFSTSIESVLPETGPVTLSPTEELTADKISMTPREEKLFGEGRLVDQDTLRVETTFPSGRVESNYLKDIGGENLAGKEYLEDAFKMGVTDPKTGIRTYTPPSPTAAAPLTWKEKAVQTAIDFPQAAYESTTAQLGKDVGMSLLSGEKTGSLTYFDDPAKTYSSSRTRGSFQGDPAPLAADQDLTDFMALELPAPPDPFGLWGGESNYRNYLNRFAPTQLKYA